MTFQPLQADDPADRVRLRKVLDAAPAYMQTILGRAPMEADVDEFFDGLPPGLTSADKLVGGFWHAGEMVGCLDLCRGFPGPEFAYIGLLLITEAFQGRGLGREALEHVYRTAQGWGCRTLRLAVIETNLKALGFWQHLGFTESDRKTVPDYLGAAILMERSIP